MKQLLRKMWRIFKPRNKGEIILRILGISSLVLFFLVAGEYIILNIFVQMIYMAIITAFLLVAKSNK